MRRKTNALVWAVVAFAVFAGALWQQRASSSVPPSERAQLNATLSLIERGGPFPYKQDGTVFSNREKLLPLHPRGYYREYTVPTPGAKNRGARRVVRGKAGETWYTRDHYKTFVRIDK